MEERSKTPAFANWLISKFIKSEYWDEFFGDLEEIYLDRSELRGRRYAQFMYWFDALHLLYGFSSFKIFKTQNNYSMVAHNLKIVFRNLFREASYSGINILGLGIGIACSIILALYLKSELTYDQHFDKHERIYRVVSQLNSGDNINLFAQTSYGVGPLMADQSAQIESYVRFTMSAQGYSDFEYEGTSAHWDDIALADPNVFDVFDHEVIYGDPKTALTEPKSIAISERFAKTYFGAENPLGKIIKGLLSDYQVTLVFADLPDNTHLKYDALITYQELIQQRYAPVYDDNLRASLWYTRSDYTYFLMSKNYDVNAFDQISTSFFEKYMGDHPDRYNSTVDFYLEPLKEIHLNSKAQRDRPHGNRFYIAGFTGIAIFVLLVACINYMNLSTARFSKRTKSIAIPKVLGAHRHQLVMQLLTESFVFVLIALLLGLVMSYLVINYSSLNYLFDKQLPFELLLQPSALLIIILGVLLMSIGAGLYPAIVLSRFSLVKKVQTKNSTVRQGLVFIQFLVSISVISCTLLMYYQMQYMQEKSLGFEKENKLMLIVRGANYIEKIDVLVNGLKQHSSVIDATVSRGQFGQSTSFEQAEIENEEGVFLSHSYNWFYIDENFIDAMGIELMKGRNFDPTIPNDANHAILVNETLVRKMGWTDPIGKRLRYDGTENPSYVVGVLKDFHFQGLQHEIESMIFWLPPKDDFTISYWTERRKKLVSRMITVSIAGNNFNETLSSIQDEWNEFNADQPFEFQFLDEHLDRQYNADIKQMKLVGLFAGLCILISCLGLFGLTSFIIEQRTKEIGVRKTLGASMTQIITLLVKNVFVIIGIAAVIGSTLSFGIMRKWLEGFYYHDSINPMAFIIAALFSFLIAFLTMSKQSIKTARANPVSALRHE